MKLMLALSIAVAVTACGNKDKEAPKAKDTPPAAAKPEAAKEPATPADPTASWTEQKAPGFAVMAARAPREQKTTAPTAQGPQPVTLYLGYEPPGFKGSFQAAVTDLSNTKKDGRDAVTIVGDAVAGLVKNVPEAKLEKDEPIAEPVGRALVVTGNHPQGGPFKVHARIYLDADKLYVVQALHPDPRDEPLAAKFVETFKLIK